jgi:hypothetical protein
MNIAWLYIGALYAAAVFLARRAGADLPKRVGLLFYVLVLLFLFKPLTTSTSIVHADILNTLPPWSKFATSTKALNSELNDVPLQIVPWAHQVRESWRSFHAPLWNPGSASGYPLLANGQSSALSPIRLLAVPLPLGPAMAAEAAMKLLIALTFTFLYCRGRGWSLTSCIAGALVFGFGGFTNTWLDFPIVTTVCFLPAVLYFVDRLAARPALGNVVGAAIVWTSINFGGHPETASHIFVLSAMYALWIVVIERRTSWRFFVTLGGTLAIAGLLSSPFILPFIQALPESNRFRSLKVDPHKLGYTDLASTIVALQPHFYGKAPSEPLWGPATTEPVGAFAGVLGVASFFAMLVQTLRRRSWRSPETFYLVATLFAFGVFTGTPVLSGFVHAVMPIIAHARFRLVFLMMLAIQTAAAIEVTRRGEKLPLLAGSGVVAAMLVALFATTNFYDAHWWNVALFGALRSAAVLACAAAFALTRKRLVLGALLAAMTFELWSVTRSWNPPVTNDFLYNRTPLIDALVAFKQQAPPLEPFRIGGVSANLYPNTAGVYGLEDIRAHDPMSHYGYVRFLDMTVDYFTEYYHMMLEDVSGSALDFLNVRYIVTHPANPYDAARYTLVYDGQDGRILENRTVLPRFYAVRNVILEFRDDVFEQLIRKHTDWKLTALLDDLKVETPAMRKDFFDPRPEDSPMATAKIVETTPSSYHLVTNAPRWSLVVSSVPLWPGWKLERDGKRIEPIRVNGVFLGFAVPPGISHVRVWYSPWTFWVGVWLAVTTLAALAGYAWLRRARPPSS